MSEIWKDIPWYEWKYQVSNKWNVMSMSYIWSGKPKVLLLNKTRKWYLQVKLSNKIKKTCFVHSVVMLAFVWPRPEWMQINHKNWIKTDNSIENLEYCTQSENEKHSYSVLWKTRFRLKWGNSKSSVKVAQYTKDMKFIQEFSSVAEAREFVKDRWNHIWQACNWKRKFVKWFAWRYV